MSPAHHVPVSKEVGVEKLNIILPDKIHDRWQLRCVMDFDHVYDPNWAMLLSTRKPYILILDLEQKVTTTTVVVAQDVREYRGYMGQYLLPTRLTRKHAIDLLRSACKNESEMYYRRDFSVEYEAGLVPIRGWDNDALDALIVYHVKNYIDRLVREEAHDMRRNAMAKKIQKRFRKVVADPAFVFCKRRLLREFGDLERLAVRPYSL